MKCISGDGSHTHLRKKTLAKTKGAMSQTLTSPSLCSLCAGHSLHLPAFIPTCQSTEILPKNQSPLNSKTEGIGERLSILSCPSMMSMCLNMGFYCKIKLRNSIRGYRGKIDFMSTWVLWCFFFFVFLFLISCFNKPFKHLSYTKCASDNWSKHDLRKKDFFLPPRLSNLDTRWLFEHSAQQPFVDCYGSSPNCDEEPDISSRTRKGQHFIKMTHTLGAVKETRRQRLYNFLQTSRLSSKIKVSHQFHS